MIWEEFGKRIDTSREIAALGSQLLGDQVLLSNGALSFAATDVGIPGNSHLPVAFSRTYTVKDWHDVPTDLPLGDWDLEVPRIDASTFPDWVMNASSPGTGNRCSVSTPLEALPLHPATWQSDAGDHREWWRGVTLTIPGGQQGELLLLDGAAKRPSSGGPYHWIAGDQVVFSCLPSIQNGTGEGFLATAPDGTQYRFDWMAQYVEPRLVDAYGVMKLPRRRTVLYATQVADRFGNWVKYTYTNAWNAPARLTRIESNAESGTDARILTIEYNGNGHVSKVKQGSREWAYGYASTSGGRVTLTSVSQPDGSQWSIGFASLTGIDLRYIGIPSGRLDELNGPYEFYRTCLEDLWPGKPHQFTGHITHPSGATGEFQIELQRHGRSNVPVSCHGVATVGSGPPGNGNNPNNDYNFTPISYIAPTLTKRIISGPGLSPLQWSYAYEPNVSTYFHDGATVQYPVCPPYVDCRLPVCTSDDCAKSSKTTVTAPDGSWTRYSHGNSYRYNEGKLLKVETGNPGSSSPISTISYGYDLSLANRAYPARYGASVRWEEGFVAEMHRPLLRKETIQEGSAFIWQAAEGCTGGYCLDAFARPVRSIRSSPWYSRTDTTEYHDDLGKWVLGQPARSVNQDTGLVESQTSYDSNALPSQRWSYGKLQQTLAYNADGTVAAVKDGNNNTTVLGGWKRGIPQSIRYADGTTQAALVDGNGWITQVTDEHGYATGYAYDAMGRLAGIAYPSGDSTAWNTTTQAFQQVGTAEHGIAGGHWRQTVATGNARKVTYFDAMWRALVTQEYDTADVAGTQRFRRFAYNHEGRPLFASYPGSSSTLNTGIWTEYDALGRTTSVSQDSERGLLTTLTEYLENNQTRVTDPRGQKVVTGYQAFDQPAYDAPVSIQHPEGAYTDIVRDVFGKPTSLTRRSADNTQWVTRSYAYNASQELCRAVEPETGAALMGYDAAGNLAWSAAGLPGDTACQADGASGAVAARKVVRGYDGRNRLRTLAFPDGRGDQTWSYTADGLPASVVTHNGDGSPSVTNGYAYNKRRLLVSESLSQPGYAWSLGYQYDGNGALSGLTYPSGLQVALAPNALGQPTQAGSYARDVAYYPNGAIRQFTYGNGIVHSMVQNARQLPARVQSGNAVGYEYEYDGNANPVAIHDLARGTGYSRTLQYDGLDRLTAAGSPMFGGDQWHRFTYDAVDNLTSWKLAGVKDFAGYHYDAVTNRLQSIRNTANATVVGLAYDEQGNLSNKNGQQYAFDFGNRLREAKGQEAYSYDAYGRRVRASDWAQVPILSMYGQDGTLRRQENQRSGKQYEYITLAGSLVAKVTTVVAPGTPALTAPGYSSNGGYTVSWTSVPTATAYELQESANGNGWAATYSGTGTSKAYTGKGSGSYGYRARACQASSCSSWSNVGTVTVELPPAGAPSLSVPASAPNGGYTVGWTSVGGATTYALEESANGGSWASVQTSAAMSKAYSGKAAGSYGYRVKACNPAGCGAVSATGTVQVFYPPASAPMLAVPASSYTGSYSVTWGTVAGATSYQLEEQSNGGAWGLAHNAAGTSKALSGKAAGSYGYRVKACNTAGCGPVSGTGAVRVTLPPASAPGLSVPGSSYTGSYTVSWSGVAAATAYRLEERVAGGSWTQIQDGGTTSRAISGKAAGTYEYRARACNVAGCSGYGATAAIQITLVPTGVPTLNLPASSMTGSYAVSWSAVSAATAYQLEERANGGSWSQIHNAAATNKTVTGKPAGTYEYRVRACNAAGCGGYSSLKSITLTTPPTPSLSVTQLSSNCRSSWSTSTGADRYELRDSVAVIYTGSSGTYAQYSPSTCRPPYMVRACNGNGCSGWSAPVYPPGVIIQSLPGSVPQVLEGEGGEE